MDTSDLFHTSNLLDMDAHHYALKPSSPSPRSMDQPAAATGTGTGTTTATGTSGRDGPGYLVEEGAVERLGERLVAGQEVHRLSGRVWVFEEDLWQHSLHTSGMDAESQMAVVSDQVCVMLPHLRRVSTLLPPRPVVQSLYMALTLHMGITWGQCVWPPNDADEAAEGRARSLLFLLKTLHLHHFLRAFASVDQLLLLHHALPNPGPATATTATATATTTATTSPLVRQVRALGRLQQIFLQTAAHADILLKWKHGLLLRPNHADHAPFLRQCLLDVPPDEELDLFPLLAAVLRLPDPLLLNLQAILAHAQDFQLQMLTLLLRKPTDILVDVYDMATARSHPPSLNQPYVPSALPLAHTPSVAHLVNTHASASAAVGTTTSASAQFAARPMSPGNSIFSNDLASTLSVSKDLRLIILRQPPKETIKDKILNPSPSVRIDGLNEDDDSSYVIRASLVRFGEVDEIDDGVHGSIVHQVSGSRIVNFKKIKIRYTCKQLSCTRVSVKFQLLRQTDMGSYETCDAEVSSSGIEVYSHTSQLHSGAREDMPPTIAGLVPDHGPVSGGTTIAILASDLTPNPDMVIMFGPTKLRPVHMEIGWVIAQTPPYTPSLGNIVSVSVSLDGGITSCTSSLSFKYTSA